jgi:hypothetical protein
MALYLAISVAVAWASVLSPDARSGAADYDSR